MSDKTIAEMIAEARRHGSLTDARVLAILEIQQAQIEALRESIGAKAGPAIPVGAYPSTVDEIVAAIRRPDDDPERVRHWVLEAQRIERERLARLFNAEHKDTQWYSDAVAARIRESA